MVYVMYLVTKQNFIIDSLFWNHYRKILSDLIKFAYMRNSHDNISIILIYI